MLSKLTKLFHFAWYSSDNLGAFTLELIFVALVRCERDFLHSIGMTVLKNGNNRHSSLYNERTALTAYPDQGRLLKPCLHPSAFQSVCRSMCDALHASTWEWTYTMCLGLYMSECRLLSQWQSSLFLCGGFMHICVTHCLRSCLPCFQLSWLLGASGRTSFSLPSSNGKKKQSSSVKLKHKLPINNMLNFVLQKPSFLLAFLS